MFPYLHRTLSCGFIRVSLLTLFGLFSVSSPIPAAMITGTVDLGPEPRMPRLHGRYAQHAGGEPGPRPPRVAVVYLEGVFSPHPVAPAGDGPILEQEGLQFRPALLPIMVGTTVSFPNLDETYHNVFSYSKAKAFDLGRYLDEEKIPRVTFEEPGVVSVFCEIHNHMRATILVLDSPHFVTTDTSGSFRLEGLPAGEFTLVGWVNERRVFRRRVSLEVEDELEVDLNPKSDEG